LLGIPELSKLVGLTNTLIWHQMLFQGKDLDQSIRWYAFSILLTSVFHFLV
jgi:hypothetical protein